MELRVQVESSPTGTKFLTGKKDPKFLNVEDEYNFHTSLEMSGENALVLSQVLKQTLSAFTMKRFPQEQTERRRHQQGHNSIHCTNEVSNETIG